MPSVVNHLEFGPPRDEQSLRAWGLALVAHLLLIAALTWGVNWKSTDDASSSFAAELWTAAPQATQEAAPVLPPPIVPPPPQPEPPQPTPIVPPPPAQETPITPDVDIALAQEKKRKQLENKKLADQAREKDRLDRLLAEQKALEKAQLAKADAAQKAKKAKDAKAAKELQAAIDARDKKLEAQKADAAKDADKKLAQAKQAQADKVAEAQRQQNMKRLASLAGTTGSTDGKTSNKASSGGSGSSTTYGAIVRAAIMPNVVFTDEIVGNPIAKVEVRVALDGMIISQRLLQSSGNKNWDDAALNAIIRTRVMPRDVDGRIPDTILILEMRPRG